MAAYAGCYVSVCGSNLRESGGRSRRLSFNVPQAYAALPPPWPMQHAAYRAPELIIERRLEVMRTMNSLATTNGEGLLYPKWCLERSRL